MTRFAKKIRLLLRQPKRAHSLDIELEQRFKRSVERHYLITSPRR